MKKLNLVLLPLSAMALASCSFDFSIHSLSFSSSAPMVFSEESYPSLSVSMAEEGEGYYRPAKVNDGISFHDIAVHNGDSILPSVGKFKILVLPIEFSDCPFGESRLADIRTAFAGTDAETKYWESLKSFYYKSSYGALDLDFVFADPYVAGTTPMAWFDAHKDEEIEPGYTYGEDPTSMAGLAMQHAVAAYKTKSGDDCKQFDYNGDGYIDACMMIYSCHNNNKTRFDVTPFYPEIKTEKYGNLFWAYQYSDSTTPEPVPSSPVGNRYFWASYDFFYDGVKEGEGVDAHTVIHETGHVLGADDYYNYATDKGEHSNPSGGKMMMSHNILDHDCFTKLNYGWVRPYVVTGDATITIRPFESSGECVLLADSWNGTAFDEYVLFQLYTPTGLNEKDSRIAYSGGTKGFEVPGVIGYHIDGRLVKGKEYTNDGRFNGTAFLTDEEVMNFPAASKSLISRGLYVAPGITNTAFYDSTNVQGKGYELIQLIQSGGRNTVRRGDDSSEADLFTRGKTFSLGQYSAFFPETTKLNNGSSLPYEVYFEQVNGEYATLKITKKA